jgi:uncharacterized membrane protein YhaH (DUF805 family)
MHTALALFFSFKGRLRRRTFYWTLAALLGAFFVLFTFLEDTVSRGSTLVLYPPYLWSAFALAVRRLHDREQSAWWLLVLLIPVVGPLLMSAWLLLGRGTRGSNRFGSDPRETGADYLQVSIDR